MCTVTVSRKARPDGASLIVTMNRDERRDRMPEISPSIYSCGHLQAIYPLDQQASGTWFGVNQFGLALSVLNRYDEITYEAERSRGLLIPDLLTCENLAAVKSSLQEMSLSQYAPFTLFMNSINESEVLQWNGREARFEQLVQHSHQNYKYQHLSSSSWQPVSVLSWRQKAFEAWLNNGAEHNQQGLPSYNLYQPEGKAEYAPFVSRPKTYTKSITQFEVSEGHIVSRYWNDTSLPNGDFQELVFTP